MRIVRFVLVTAFAFITVTAAATPPARKIPGITIKDSYARACVDCHTGKAGMPVALSASMKAWSEKVDAKLLATSQASAPKGMTLKGKHPNAMAMVKDMPGGCLKCHAKGSKIAPAFATMIHAIHLTGGEANPFLTTFQGECTHCHKLNAATGAWSMPSAPEK